MAKITTKKTEAHFVAREREDLKALISFVRLGFRRDIEACRKKAAFGKTGLRLVDNYETSHANRIQFSKEQA